jgi:hypothetical protein
MDGVVHGVHVGVGGGALDHKGSATHGKLV